MDAFDEYELTPAEIEACEIAELYYNNPGVLDQDIVMETDEIRAIREISGIDLSIFEVSLNNYIYFLNLK